MDVRRVDGFILSQADSQRARELLSKEAPDSDLQKVNSRLKWLLFLIIALIMGIAAGLGLWLQPGWF